jgi:hypothetical protein
LILEEPERPPEVIEEPEGSPPVQIIPTYHEDELVASISNLDFPLSVAGRMYEEEKKT